MAAAPSAPLKLAALDAEDLAVISAHVQDAVLKVGEMAYLASEKRFTVLMNRFAWEAGGSRRRGYERRRSALHFDRVLAVRSTGIRREAAEAVAELLAIEFRETDAPAGEVTLIFAGGGAVRLDVEVIEAQLADLGAAWQTKALPAHDLSDQPE